MPERHDYYVYVLLRPDTLIPFYIGFGRGDRWKDHEQSQGSCARTTHKNNIIRAYRARGYDVIPKFKITEGLTKLEAVALEIEWIAKLGREPNGPLVNATPGGDGVREWTIEQRAAISKKVSASLIGNQYRKGIKIPHTQETKDKIGASHITSPRVYRGSLGHIGWNKGGHVSPETLAKMTAAARLRAAEGRHHMKTGMKLGADGHFYLPKS
jgi:hypothetical protein